MYWFSDENAVFFSSVFLQINEDLQGEVHFLSQTGPFTIPVVCSTKKCDVSTSRYLTSRLGCQSSASTKNSLYSAPHIAYKGGYLWLINKSTYFNSDMMPIEQIYIVMLLSAHIPEQMKARNCPSRHLLHL